MQTASCASLQLSGVIQLKSGVYSWVLQVVDEARRRVVQVRDVVRVAVRAAVGRLVQRWAVDRTAPVSDWNQGNGKCLATYWSFGCAAVKVVTPCG